MNGFRVYRALAKRVFIPCVVALALLVALAGFPSASVDEGRGVSSSGAPDILLLHDPVGFESRVGDWQPEQVVSEIRARNLEDSVRLVLARYPRFIDSSEQENLARLLITEGQRQGIDPLFLAALIRVESAFSANAISDKGARGLMQVMPATGAEMAQKLGLEWDGANGLHNPAYNLRIGSYYLRCLLDHYSGNYRHALTAYNRGPRNLRYLVKRHGGLQNRYTAYFQKIQQIYQKYQTTMTVGGALLDIG